MAKTVELRPIANRPGKVKRAAIIAAVVGGTILGAVGIKTIDKYLMSPEPPRERVYSVDWDYCPPCRESEREDSESEEYREPDCERLLAQRLRSLLADVMGDNRRLLEQEITSNYGSVFVDEGFEVEVRLIVDEAGTTILNAQANVPSRPEDDGEELPGPFDVTSLVKELTEGRINEIENICGEGGDNMFFAVPVGIERSEITDSS